MANKDIEPGSELDKETDKVFAALEAYREWIKRNDYSRLGGVMWIRKGNDCIVYSQSERYTQQIHKLTCDPTKDEFRFIEREEEE